MCLLSSDRNETIFYSKKVSLSVRLTVRPCLPPKYLNYYIQTIYLVITRALVGGSASNLVFIGCVTLSNRSCATLYQCTIFSPLILF